MLNLALQRKGAPPSGPTHKPGLAIMIGMGGRGGPPPDGQSPNDQGNANEGNQDDGDIVACPNCGCQFNDETGEIVNADQGGPQGPPPPDAQGAGPSGPSGPQNG